MAYGDATITGAKAGKPGAGASGLPRSWQMMPWTWVLVGLSAWLVVSVAVSLASAAVLGQIALMISELQGQLPESGFWTPA